MDINSPLDPGEIRVIDNFLLNSEFAILSEEIQAKKFPWFYNPAVSTEGDGLFQYFHMFYSYKVGKSYHYELILPTLRRLGGDRLHRAKVNSRTITNSIQKSNYHTDISDKIPYLATAILYINTNNGYTQFKESGRKIKSVANRVVVFDPDLEHMGTSSTDENRRIVLNLNYTLPHYK